MIKKWLAVHGLTLADYIEHLRSGGTSDGLKVWLLSMATDILVNIFQEDRACSTSQQGLDLECPSIVLTTYHSGVWCKEGLDEAEAGRVPVLLSGVPWPQQCPICDVHLDSGLALERHIRSLHPLSRSYSCRDCEAAFITPCQLASHVSNVHRQKKVSCKKCEYVTVSKVKMR